MTSPAEVGADLACRRTLDHISLPVRIWVRDAGVVYVNRSWLELTGTTLEDNTGDGWLRFVHDDDRDGLQAWVSQFPSEPSDGMQRDYRLRRRDGTPVAVSDRISSWTDEDSRHVLGVVHTITVRQSDEDRGRTMSKWAHELRGPLNAILGWSDLLAAGDSAAEVVQRGLRAIATNARQQAQIIKRMTE